MRDEVAAVAIAVTAAFATAGQAYACDFCDRYIVLTESLAKCYLERVAGEIDDLRAAAQPARMVNLLSCPGVPVRDRGGTLPGTFVRTENKAEASPPPAVTTTFFLTEEGLFCLEAVLKTSEWSGADEAKTFVMLDDCHNE